MEELEVEKIMQEAKKKDYNEKNFCIDKIKCSESAITSILAIENGKKVAVSSLDEVVILELNQAEKTFKVIEKLENNMDIGIRELHEAGDKILGLSIDGYFLYIWEKKNEKYQKTIKKISGAISMVPIDSNQIIYCSLDGIVRKKSLNLDDSEETLIQSVCDCLYKIIKLPNNNFAITCGFGDLHIFNENMNIERLEISEKKIRAIYYCKKERMIYLGGSNGEIYAVSIDNNYKLEYSLKFCKLQQISDIICKCDHNFRLAIQLNGDICIKNLDDKEIGLSFDNPKDNVCIYSLDDNNLLLLGGGDGILSYIKLN